MSLSDSTTSAALNAAQELIKACVASAAVETSAGLLEMMRNASVYHRRSQLAFAQAHLMQRQESFVVGFGVALRAQISAALDAKGGAGADRALTDWDAVSLVEGDQIEERISFERLSQVIAHDCEHELLDLARFMSALLRHGATDPERNPLRGIVIGSALQQAIEKITEDTETQKVLAKELGQTLAKSLPGCYRAIIEDLKARHVQPADLALVQTKSSAPAGAAGMAPDPASSLEAARRFWEKSMQGSPLIEDPGDALRSWESSVMGRNGGYEPLPEGFDPESSAALLDRLMRGGMPAHLMRAPGSPADAPYPTGTAAPGSRPAGGFPGGMPPGTVPAGGFPSGGVGAGAAPLGGFAGGRPPTSGAAFGGFPGGNVAGGNASGGNASGGNVAGGNFAGGHGLSGFPGGSGPGGVAAGGNFPPGSYAPGHPAGPASNPASSQSDVELMGLLRRLGGGDVNRDEFGGLGIDPLGDSGPSSRFGSIGGEISVRQALGAAGDGAAYGSGYGQGEGLSQLMAVNLIRAHRDELLQAARGKLDHMVIEVVSSLFDQILSDVRVPSQMARQIARLQLPVLRVALRDATFFSSRRHPVRRFINRVSSLAASFDDFAQGAGKELLIRVSHLIKEIVDGDFDQLEVYSEKLLQLEKFVAEQAQAELQASTAGATLRAKELEWRQIQRFSGQLRQALEPLALPPFVKEFLSQVWGQVIVTVSLREGADSARARQLRRAGYDLVASIQPKRSADQRKQFLATLPRLMATLNEGIALIAWPEADSNAFFGLLISAHAGSLKGATGSELEHNLLMKHLEAAFRTPIPGPEELGAEPAVEARDVVIEQSFSADEAKRVGLLADAAVDWNGTVDIDLAFDEPAAVPDLVLEFETEPAEGDASAPLPSADSRTANSTAAATESSSPSAGADDAEPTDGPQLRHHMELGRSYRMHLQDRWEKVRLTYMSPARNLFMFTHGSRDRQTISMTARMLERLCVAKRMRTFENAPLIDRATDRAKRQLIDMEAAAKSATIH